MSSRRKKGTTRAAFERLRSAAVRRAAILVLSSAGLAYAASPDLAFEMVITRTRYCQANAGQITIDLQFQLRSQTAAPVPLVLPSFAQVSGYELFRDEAAARLNTAESRKAFTVTEALDASKIESSEPDPKLFNMVLTGQTAIWYGRVSVPVLPADNSASLLGQERYLRVHMKPWPADKKTGERLRRLWQARGLLWTTELVSLPIRIQIETEPKTSACWMQID